MASNHLHTDLATFQALDQLPPDLYREVCYAARVWDAKMVLSLYKQAHPRMGAEAAVDWLTASIQAGDEQALRDFGAQFRRKYKRLLPHIAADATILRFMESGGAKRHYLPRSASREIQRAWQASERLLPRSD